MSYIAHDLEVDRPMEASPKSMKGLIHRILIRPVPDERTFLSEQLSIFAKSLKNKLILDIGAGQRQYQNFFTDNRYESCDLESGFHPDAQHDFLANIYDIPKENNHYDVVLMLQVLEHLEFPIRGLKEVHRILKSAGLLFLSVPQAAGDHFEPYHYFNYTQFGLKSVLHQAGFEIKEHYRLAGIFHYVSNRMNKLGLIIFGKYRRDRNILKKLCAALFYVICNWSAYVISLFNFIDQKKNYCIGHIVIAQKK